MITGNNNIPFVDENLKMENALKTTNFKSLSKMEERKGFNESVTSPKTKKKIKFFNLGQKNNWKELLDSKNINFFYEDLHLIIYFIFVVTVFFLFLYVRL